MLSKPVEFSEVAKLNDVFKSDIGRRSFTQMLKKTMKDTQSLIVSEPSFELLLFIFNTVLQNQDESRSKVMEREERADEAIGERERERERARGETEREAMERGDCLSFLSSLAKYFSSSFSHLLSRTSLAASCSCTPHARWERDAPLTALSISFSITSRYEEERERVRRVRESERER
jgi:hypothetical protein